MIKGKTKELKISKGTPLPMGISKIGTKVQFAVSVNCSDKAMLNLYPIGKKEKEVSIALDQSMKDGNVFSIQIDNFPYEKYEYTYEVNGKEFMDPYAKKVSGREVWGNTSPSIQEGLFRGGIVFDEYPWDGDEQLKIPFWDSIMYQIHVRGFTKHSSSMVKNRGTFSGIIEKIPYLKELGINGLVLMPAYEFNEVIPYKEQDSSRNPFIDYSNKQDTIVKLNYWGYGTGCNYFAPKSSYATDSKNPVKEMKDLIKELHKNGIELIMEICFEGGTNPNVIIDCLRYWVLEYHVDGFRINDNVVPSKVVAQDPILSHTKILTTSWPVEEIYGESFTPIYKNLAEYNDGFLVDSRRFLKSDEEQVSRVLDRMRKNPGRVGVINYISNMTGFTLMDLVSYDIKHNEENGENGNDGTDYNYSWNCGVEGKTKRKNVLALRRKQIKNGLLMLLLSQGTPMILSGDEFGNTCNGNNNPYCQDNSISWINWNQLNTNKDIFEFVKQIISLRQQHCILHMPFEFRVMDYISCGCPDISFHGTKAWYPDFSNYSRIFAVMLCGKYAKIDRVNYDNDFYIGFNMHWEPHTFDLPKLSDHKKWSVCFDTSIVKEKQEELENQKNYLIKARSIVVLIGK